MYSGVTKLPSTTDALCAKTLGMFLNMINISLQYLSIHYYRYIVMLSACQEENYEILENIIDDHLFDIIVKITRSIYF